MDGISLCTLNETDFKQRAPQCGDILYAQLDIWKTGMPTHLLLFPLLRSLCFNLCDLALKSGLMSNFFLSFCLSISAANLAPHTCVSFKGFRPEEQGLMELNALLNQWPNSPSCDQHVNSPMGSPIKQEPLDTPVIKMECMSPAMSSCASPHSTLSLPGFSSERSVGEANVVTSDYGSEGTQSDGMYTGVPLEAALM